MHLQATRQFYRHRHYAKGNNTPSQQPEARQPPIVDLLTPDSNDAETIQLMLTTLADSIARRAPIPINNIFINHRPAQSRMVLGDGKVVERSG